MKKRKNFRLPVISIHILIWMIVFCIPLLAWTDSETPFHWKRYFHFCVTQFVFMAVFYINYFVLIGKLLFRKKTGPYVVFMLMIICLAAFILYGWHRAGMDRDFPGFSREAPSEATFQAPPPGLEDGFIPGERLRPNRGVWMFILRDGVMLLLVSGLALAVRMTVQWFKNEREKQALEAARSEAELKNLKNQLNPHFLFNTLNNIYSLIGFNPEKARYAVESLSRLLRHVLYENDLETVPVEHEFEFIRSYVELMALRLPSTVELEVDIPEKGNGVTILPLLFINPVENAFKHGVSSKTKSFIRIVISIEADKKVICTVENSYIPPPPGRMASGSGIGLENQKKRLELLYPGRHTLINERRGDRYYSYLEINL